MSDEEYLKAIRMTLQDIGFAVNDPESAHIMEDDLWFRTLQTIASGRVEDAPSLAAAALKTTEFDFPRWHG